MRWLGTVAASVVGLGLALSAPAEAGTGAKGSPIIVAVEQGSSSSGTASLLAAQLNDDTYYDFTATVVTASQIDTTAELSAYQVVVLGSSGYGADYDWTSAMATAMKSWLSSGGGVVGNGWIDYAITTSTTGGIGADMDDLIPIDAYPDSTNWFCYGSLSISVSSTSHPVTTGITSISTSSNDIEISPYASDATGGTVLGTASGSSCTGSPTNAIVVGTYGSGREVYLGLLYGAASGYTITDLRSGNADRLLEQAVAWSAFATGSYTYYKDADGDGYGNSALSTTSTSSTAPSGYTSDKTDCDDTSSSIHPGATETCNSKDDDCDGSIDEGVTSTYYLDSDGDGYGVSSSTTTGCSKPSGYSTVSTDCDDTSKTIYPGATETCNSKDDDCDGSVDEGVTVTYYRDADGDGYGTSGTTTTGCSVPSGYSTSSTDCDDSASSVHPGATETCNSVDDDCDGSVDEGVKTTYYKDADGDGYGLSTSSTTACSAPVGYVASSTDCDDTRSSVYPGATETCNSIDDDCDGTVDEGVKTTYYKDGDGDGYGLSTTSTSACSAPSGYVTDSTDCNDTLKTVHPGATEYCNSRDDDCDGVTDEDDAADAVTWYYDGDSDTYGDASNPYKACSAPSGFVATDTDCDDTDATVHPGATETPYDGVDQDCDGADLVDVDGDGYTADTVGGTDCDDVDGSIHPGAAESADGVDQDCDGQVDEATDWVDDDGDGFAEAGGDCDDGDASVSPAATETCNGVDDDCDGTVDEGTSCYDDDGDGVTEDDGDCNDQDAAIAPPLDEVDGNGIDDDCDGVVDSGIFDDDGDGYTADGGDCDPADGSVHPGATETANGVDDDCDGEVDEGTADADDDGDGVTEAQGDCDDSDASIHPTATETVNGIDDDCDGVVDDGTDAADDDGDGASELDGDCDDGNPDVGPYATESANGADDDCDGEIDEGLDDLDGDGVTVEDGDCDDHDGWVRPGLSEICDELDNDCDGEVDEENVCNGENTNAVTSTGKCGCASDGADAAIGLLPLLLAAVGLRRRR